MLICIYVMPKACRLIYRNQLSVVLELKPNAIDAQNLAQAIVYVIAANSLFDVPGRPSPVGLLSDLIDQWYLIWIGKEGEVFYLFGAQRKTSHSSHCVVLFTKTFGKL